ncbi:hypothetical protein KC19_1G222700 [Ceratodon purpureus]|uniref:Uncharacterized protein n=1 Tax=Ceratodon purpureus TaxID=3225 RepID=A0A8T0JBI7_CERPU|nr:hypothetical protein KC19_1G222700 [Ceratodon purpureus]
MSHITCAITSHGKLLESVLKGVGSFSTPRSRSSRRGKHFTALSY